VTPWDFFNLADLLLKFQSDNKTKGWNNLEILINKLVTRLVLEDNRVIGVDGLRVCDASIFPLIPGYNTSRPSYMVGEVLADKIKGNR
jgi:hypothetical protein